MDLVEEITIAITSAVESHGLILEEVTVASPGNRRLITCVVDSLGSINLDDVTVASKEISSILDAADFLDEIPFTLEVTSPGVDRPLTQPRHWLKNLNRLVRSVMVNGEVVIGRVDAVHDESVCVVVPGKIAKKVELPFVEIERAHVEIEFNRKGEDI